MSAKLPFTSGAACGRLGCTNDQHLLEVTTNGRTVVLCPKHAEALTEETQ